ncbi:MAG: putative PurR-regulated permease PerM [Crocinitomix sp.]|jgi:predicted PurR-regulated permease PerM
MQENNVLRIIWNRILLPLIIIAALFYASWYLYNVYQNQGIEKFLSSLVLVCALVIGSAHIIFFILRKLYEPKKSPAYKRKKRHLEKWRNIVNYLTPFVLVAMLYHFWMKSWILATVIVAVLLFDRINELRRKNK